MGCWWAVVSAGMKLERRSIAAVEEGCFPLNQMRKEAPTYGEITFFNPGKFQYMKRARINTVRQSHNIYKSTLHYW
jgi:hypothetical protein